MSTVNPERFVQGNHTDIKIKCLHCGLHFSICTWEPEKRLRGELHCPECGETKPQFVWSEQVTAQIFEHVPGLAEMESMETTKQ